MKKIIKIILLSILIFSFANSFAEDEVYITVTEKIPWANCEEELVDEADWWAWNENLTSEKVHYWRWKCKVKPWFWSVVQMFWAIIKYFTYIAWLGWVLFIVINGMMYSMWWMDQTMKDESKKRIVKTLVWLILLFLSWVILYIVAPWIYNWG